MNRKEFLKNCACGLCSVAALGLTAPSATTAAEASPPEDWRLGFIRHRYARLLEILWDKLDDATANEILRQMGYHCADSYSLLQQHRGDVDGFIREFKKRMNEDITYDREQGIVTVVGPERTECFCPFIGGYSVSGKVCACSLGWQQCVYETLLDRPVRVKLKESVLRGGKRCVFEIQVSNERPRQSGGNAKAETLNLCGPGAS